MLAENPVEEGIPTIRLLIADDHYLVRTGLVALLGRNPQFQVVAEASNGLEAIKAFEEYRPNVALMDLRMPVLGGIDAITRIRDLHPNAKILVLTSFDGDEGIFRALQAGARGYCLKNTPAPELFEAIQAVASGHRHVPPHIAAKLIERMNETELTPREHDVLRLIATGKSNQQIGASLFISAGTVKSHVNHILMKLDADDRTTAVIKALRRGLVDLDQSDSGG